MDLDDILVVSEAVAKKYGADVACLLAILAKGGGALTTTYTELADRLGVSYNTVVRLVQRMKIADLVVMDREAGPHASLIKLGNSPDLIGYRNA